MNKEKSMNDDVLLKISQAVALMLNENKGSDLGAKLNSIIPADIDPEERAKALDEAVVYSLYAEQPGYPQDGQPGYLPADADLKAAVLNEINAMIEADFDKEEHRKVWESLRESVASTPESDFIPGVSVNCPDDYLLNLERYTCAELLRTLNFLPAWA